MHDGLLVAQQRHECWHDPLVHLARELHAEGGDELDRVGDQDGVRRCRRLQLGEG